MSETKRTAPAAKTPRKRRTKAQIAAGETKVGANADQDAGNIEAGPVADSGEVAPIAEATVAKVPAMEAKLEKSAGTAPSTPRPGNQRESRPNSREGSQDDRQEDREERDDRDNRGNRSPGGVARRDPNSPRAKTAPATNPNSPAAAAPAATPIQESYSVHFYFDKNIKSFVAGILEIPEVKVTGPSKEAVLKDLDTKLEAYLQNAKRRGDLLPEAIFARRYPEKLELKLSQSLQRKLDILARHEKVGVDQMIVELLTSGAEKRAEANRPHESHRPKHQGGAGQHQSQHGQGGGNSQQRHPQHQSGNRDRGRSGNRNYQDTMNNRENFMEYVRSLEKGNYRKK